ncbi:MAG: leucine-rich repeat domain-containing protein [Promethearchaeota archaeon]
MTYCNLSNLDFFPQNCPNLEYIWLDHNHLTSLKGLPPKLPKLISLNIINNNLTTLKDIPKIDIHDIQFNENPLRTLFGLNGEEIKEIIYQSNLLEMFDLSPRGNLLIKEYRRPIISEGGIETFDIYPFVLKKIIKFYRKPIPQIAENYVKHIKHGEEFMDNELDRLIWEADYNVRKFLEANLPMNDPVLLKINQRLSIKLPSDFRILK